jgi:hypothetical protein
VRVFDKRVIKRIKAKAVPLHATKALGGERRYSSYSFSTSVLGGGEWSASRHGRALAPRKRPPVPIVQEAGWAPEPVWIQRLEEKFFRLPGIQPRSPGLRSDTILTKLSHLPENISQNMVLTFMAPENLQTYVHKVTRLKAEVQTCWANL